MKGTSDRTKVVLRHLPPTITQSMLMEQIDGRFAGRYNWIIFRPGNNRFGFIHVYIYNSCACSNGCLKCIDCCFWLNIYSKLLLFELEYSQLSLELS